MFFSFRTVEIGDIEKEINNINSKKATTSNSIPPKISKKSSKVSATVLHKLFNDSIEKSDFPQNLKLADITPVYKKNDPLAKTNYRPVSILPVVSKIFGRILQLLVFFLPIYVVIGRVLILNTPYQHLLRIEEKTPCIWFST